MVHCIRNLTNKGLLVLLLLGLILSVSLSIVVTNSFHKALVENLRQSEIENIFVSIETGPLSLARLHAGSISNDFLDRLMNQTRQQNNLFQEVKILSGANNDVVYSTWSKNLTSVLCQKTISKKYQFKDALNPFTVSITIDDCYELPLEKRLKTITLISSMMIIIVVFLLLILVAIPLVRSMKLAIRMLQNNHIDEHKIPYLPVRKLVSMAKRSILLEGEVAYSKVAQSKLESELTNWMDLCEEKDLVCRQIYHDLASPLGLLKVSTSKLGDQALSKPFALSLDRLTKITEDLQTQKYIWGSENPKLETLKESLDAILHEKRLLTSHLKIQFKLKTSKKSLGQMPDIPSSQFHRVLSNILNNAIDALKTKGTIRIITRTSGSNIQLFIADSGQGIPKDIAPHIFEKKKSFNKPQGSGLGLYHAKTCIEAFGGQLNLLSTSQGAAFRIVLPIARN